MNLDVCVVYVAPTPLAPWFVRINNRMIGFSKVRSSMLILRGVTAARVATGKAEAHFHPRITNLYTVDTSF